MRQALYRKYRSRSFNEVVGQDHITQTLKNALNEGKISHAYLFTGPRGVGKTSVARILAHEVNGLEYRDDSFHMDIIEIDAASNRRIDEIRDLREKVHIVPTSGKFKVYIIDEVHMLTREAFNALLKTLEEPPAHSIFILATTEAHKLPETIVSRVQRFSFKPVSHSQSAEHLRSIAKMEKIDINEGALQLIAEHGQGSFRDSIGLLDQLSSTGKTINEDVVRAMLGLPPSELIKELISSITSGSSSESLKILSDLWEQGADPVIVARQLSQKLRSYFLKNVKDEWLISLLKELIEVPSSAHPRDLLEINILEATSKNQKKSISSKNTPNEAEKSAREMRAKSESSYKQSAKDQKNKNSAKQTAKDSFTLDLWESVVGEAKHQAASLYTALRLAIPQLSGNSLILVFEFPLHQKKVKQAKNLETLGRIIEESTGVKIRIECKVDKDLFRKKSRKDDDSRTFSLERGSPVEVISNIFGPAEVLES